MFSFFIERATSTTPTRRFVSILSTLSTTTVPPEDHQTANVPLTGTSANQSQVIRLHTTTQHPIAKHTGNNDSVTIALLSTTVQRTNIGQSTHASTSQSSAYTSTTKSHSTTSSGKAFIGEL